MESQVILTGFLINFLKGPITPSCCPAAFSSSYLISDIQPSLEIFDLPRLELIQTFSPQPIEAATEDPGCTFPAFRMRDLLLPGENQGPDSQELKGN